MADNRSDALVLFGITGDLAKKKLFPALYHLEERDRLSRQVHDGAIQVLALVARRGREIGGRGPAYQKWTGQPGQ